MYIIYYKGSKNRTFVTRMQEMKKDDANVFILSNCKHCDGLLLKIIIVSTNIAICNIQLTLRSRNKFGRM